MYNIAELFQKEDYSEGEEERLASIEYVNVRQSIDGVWSSIPQQFTIDELGTVEQLHAALGPGSYELLARNGRNSRLMAKPRVVVAPGPGESPRGRRSSVTEQVSNVQMPVAEDKSDRFMVMMMQMMQAQSQQAQTMMTGMMTMITGVLTAGRADSDKYTQQMAQMFTSFGTQQTSLLQSVMQRGQASDPQEVFLRAVETVNELRAGAAEEKTNQQSGASELQETLAAVSQGLDLYGKVKGIGQAVAPTVPD